MKIGEEVVPEDRGSRLLKWRTTLGWGLADTANRLGVTPRTLSSHESGAQPVPDSRWRLFVHEVTDVLRTGGSQGGLIVVTGDDGYTCIDVVSADNYAGIAISDDGKRGLIASYAIDRQTGQPYLFRQPFLVKVNRGILKTVEAWEEVRRAQAQDEAVYHMQRWIMRRALKGEIEHPDFAALKLAMHVTSDRIKAEQDASEDDKARLFEEHEAAVAAFVEALASSQVRK